MKAKIIIFQDKKKEFRYSIVAGNNKKIATPGEGYKTHEGVKKAAARLKMVMPGATVLDKTEKK